MNQNYNDSTAKSNLIHILTDILSSKISQAIQPITRANFQIEKLKKEITNKINEIDKVTNKAAQINKVIQGLNQETDSLQIPKQEEPTQEDPSNLDSILIIKNKPYYELLAKEKTVEEYLLVIKNAFSKKNISFKEALGIYRENSRIIFYLKYKNKTNKNDKNNNDFNVK